MGKDWLSYLLEPHTLLIDLDHITDDKKFSLIKHFLSQAELHDRRAAAMASDSTLKQTLLEFGLPSTTFEQSGYDKSKMLDCLALQIAASFHFNANLFAGFVTDLSLRLSSRLYRTLFLTLLERNSRGTKEIDLENGSCTTPYDLGPWESLEPTLAFAALAYHLWCLQVAQSERLLAQPHRSLTPIVAGLSEVPESAFLPDSRADRDAIITRHEESALRLYNLLKCLDGGALAVARPTAALFASSSGSSTPILEEETLSINRLIAGVSFSLGRLAFQNNLTQKAVELFSAARKAISVEQLDCIEEAGATPLLIDSYLAACTSKPSPEPYIEAPDNRFALVDNFCTALKYGLEKNDLDHALFLGTSVSPIKASLRISPTVKEPRKSSKVRSQPPFSQEAICNALEEDLYDDENETAPPLGFGLRRFLEQLAFGALTQLVTRCKDEGKITKTKELTQLRRTFRDWQTFYTRVVISNGIGAIIHSSATQIIDFCHTLLDADCQSRKVPPAASIDIAEAANFLFADLNRLIVEKVRPTEAISFLRDLAIQMTMRFPTEGQPHLPSPLVETLFTSPLIDHLPPHLRILIRNPTTGNTATTQVNELPDVVTTSSPSSLLQEEVGSHPTTHRSRFTDTRTGPRLSPISLLIASSNPKVVMKACGDMLNSGWTPDAILQSGGWWENATLIPLLKWTTIGDLHMKPAFQRRDPSAGAFGPPSLFEMSHRQFLGVLSENVQCMPALVLLLRVVDFRKNHLDWKGANLFRSAASNLLPTSSQGSQSGTPSVVTATVASPLWHRCLARWMRVILEHEMLVSNILEYLLTHKGQSSAVSHSPTLCISESELLRQSKSILMQIAGLSSELTPDVLISDDLISAASCLVLLCEPDVLSPLNSGSPLLEVIRILYKVSRENDEAPQSARDLHFLLCNWLRAIPEPGPANLVFTGAPAKPPQNTTPKSHIRPIMTIDMSSMMPFAGPPPSPNSLLHTDSLKFFIWLLAEQFDPNTNSPIVQQLLDGFITCLATIFASVQPLFKTDTIKEPWLSVSANTIGVLPVVAVADLLHFSLTQGLRSGPQSPKWLLLCAELELASPNPQPKHVISSLLLVAAVASDSFSLPIPSDIFTERIVLAMVQSCRSLGFLGEAIVLCQFAPQRSLIKVGIQVIESLRCPDTAETANAEKSYDSLDGLSIFVWDIELLEALATLEFYNGSHSKRATYMCRINQPELNSSNSSDIFYLTQTKRAAEFLRLLSQQCLLSV